MGGRVNRRKPGSRNVPEILNTAPTDDTSSGMFVKTVVPKLSRTAKAGFDPARFFFSSSLTVNVAAGMFFLELNHTP